MWFRVLQQFDFTTPRGKVVKLKPGQMVDVLTHIGPPPFGGITDIHDPLTRAVPGGGAAGEDFAVIAATLQGCAAVRQWVLALGDDRPLLRAIGQRLDSFDGEVRAIEKVVDARGLVKDTASERLGRIRAENEEPATPEVDPVMEERCAEVPQSEMDRVEAMMTQIDRETVMLTGADMLALGCSRYQQYLRGERSSY